MWYLLVPLFLCWGSFLNMLAYRLVHDLPLQLQTRSLCPHCRRIIHWYDLIPVISWINLRGKCRHCQNPISPLYPIIEILTTLCLIGLINLIDPFFWPIYFVFISALIVTIRTDLETMQISRLMTLCLIPLPVIASLTFSHNYCLIPLNSLQVICGAIFGYLILWIINQIFHWYAGQDGMGEGDLELLACIGAFTGLAGAWFSLVIGSLAGASYGIIFMLFKRTKLNLILPFGPFLALGALLYLFFQNQIFQLILC